MSVVSQDPYFIKPAEIYFERDTLNVYRMGIPMLIFCGVT